MTLQEIKKEFFSMRNGIVADAYRKAGDPHGLVFGLQLPQLGEIARKAGMPDALLSAALWDDSGCRESRLLSCWLADAAAIDREEAIARALDVRSREEADILAFRLLRRMDRPAELAAEIENRAADPLARYAAEALRRNLE